jgi:putative endopeptidase
MRKILFIFIVLLIFGNSLTAQEKQDFLSENIDKSTPASVDFFQYANGGWIKKTPIPASESGWGIGNLVQEEIYNRILKINKDAALAKAAPGSTTQKIGDFWFAGMDTVSIDKKGITPLKKYFTEIDDLKSSQELTRIAAEFHRIGVNCFFRESIGQDDKDSETIVYQVNQGGLGLPNREYYFKTDDRTAKIREAYKKYVVTTLLQIGMSQTEAEKSMQEIYDLELKLATSSRNLEDLRDPYKNYNKMTLDQLTAKSINFDWKKYTEAFGINKMPADSVIVGQPEFFERFGKEVKETPLSVWKNYLKLRVIQSFANYLDETTYLNAFNYSKNFSGATSPRPRWKRILDSEESSMGELLGQLFAKEYFNEKAKKRYSDLVEAIRNAYVDRINNLSWMSGETKAKALEKLSKVSKKVGYPDKWKDFSSLRIDRRSYLDNKINSNLFWHNYNINKLNKPVDRTEWDMTPQTYNAYYNPSNNEIVLPAGIFAVPGVKDEDLDDAFVYGYAAASTIGHEITHGFDDQGRQYDAKGNLTDWWTKKDGDEFKSRAKAIIDQFNEFMPVDTMHVNGEATQGENIADLGGLLLGLDAFKKTAQFKEGKLIGGLTPLQRYFLGYAYGWMYQTKKETLANRLMTDVHAPAKERVNGPVVNVKEFYEAFGIKPGDKMWRDESKRVIIW